MNKKQTFIKTVAPYGYIAPIMIIILTFVVGSIIISAFLGFTKYNIMSEPVFYGLKNYETLLGDSKFIKASMNTLKLILYIVPFQTLTGILCAAFLVANRERLLGKIVNGIIFIPVLCSSAVVGVIWKELLNGKIPVVESFFGLFGIRPSMLLGDPKAVLIVVAVVAVWKSLGYYVVIYSSGLLGISDTVYEAAKVDGAGKMIRFFKITLPLLKPTIILGIFLSVTSSLQCFDLIFTLTGGGPNNASTTLVIYAYTKCFGSGAAGYAMAISNLLFLVVLIAALMQRKFVRRDESEI